MLSGNKCCSSKKNNFTGGGKILTRRGSSKSSNAFSIITIVIFIVLLPTSIDLQDFAFRFQMWTNVALLSASVTSMPFVRILAARSIVPAHLDLQEMVKIAAVRAK